ncbi:MAG: LPS assembly lipoprotein LptE [Pseudomonadales bacterium]
MIRTFLLVSTLLLLTACGFHLRGTGAPALDVQRVALSGSPRDLIDELGDTLKTIGVSVGGDGEPEYRINLANESLTRRAVASSGAITVSEYEVRIVAIFSIFDAEGKELIPASELVAERVYSFDATNFVSNTEEEALLIEEMRQDIAGQLVRRFSATLRNQTETASES